MKCSDFETVFGSSFYVAARPKVKLAAISVLSDYFENVRKHALLVRGLAIALITAINHGWDDLLSVSVVIGECPSPHQTMKINAILALSFVTLSASVNAEVLVEWNYNNLASGSSPKIASSVSSSVTASTLYSNGLQATLFSSGGVNNSKFTCYDLFDASYNYSVTNRTTLDSFAHTVSFDNLFKEGYTVTFSSVSLDTKRPDSGSPSTIQASIFWKDSAGQVQWATSGALAVGEATDWTHLNLAFTQSSAAFPSGAGLAGQAIHVEVYAAGANNSGAYFVDNVALNGTATAVIPEPSGALLVGCVGLIVLFRRRQIA